MAIVKKWRGICVNIQENNNKFWEIELHDNDDVVTRWGRVSESGGIQTKSYAGIGEKGYDKKIREKTNKSKPDKCYTEVRTIESGGTTQTKVVSSSNLSDLAKQEIKSNSPETVALIEKLVKANIHNITSHTTMTFNKVTGLFETPLGVVTSDAVVEARDWLKQIGDIVAKNQWGNPHLITCVNQYMRLVPSDFGRRKFTPQDIFPDLAAVRQQNDILDSLDGSLQMLTSTSSKTKKASQTKTFEVTLHLMDKGQIYDQMNRMYNKTKQSMHASSRWNIHKIYQLEIAKMTREYKQYGEKLGNIKQLVHGSKIGNLLSIMKNGFIIPPSNAAHCTGRLLGNGVYTSDQWTKALNYAMGTAPGQRGGYEQIGFLFYCDIALGRCYEPRSLYESFPKPGYDSVFARGGGHTTLRNNEMVVYNTNQINPLYLIEFR